MLADVDAASVLTAAKAGTDFGYAILLPLAVLVPILYFVQEMTARLAIGTGLGHAELIRERYGFRWAGVAVGTMVLIDLLAYVAEFAGIVLGASLVGVPAVAAVAGALVFQTPLAGASFYGRSRSACLPSACWASWASRRSRRSGTESARSLRFDDGRASGCPRPYPS